MLRARQMLFQVTGEMLRYGSGFSNWAILLLEQLFPSRELVLVANRNLAPLLFTFRLASTPPACLGPDRSGGTPAPVAGTIPACQDPLLCL